MSARPNSRSVRSRITVPQPCGEDFNAMPVVAGGKFCGQCSKVITDFTRMTDAQLIDWMRNRPGSCGTFRPDQLNRDLIEPTVRKPPFRMGWLLSLLVITGCMRDEGAQDGKRKKPALEQLQTLGEPALQADTPAKESTDTAQAAKVVPDQRKSHASGDGGLEIGEPVGVTGGVPVMESDWKESAMDTAGKRGVRPLIDSFKADDPGMIHYGRTYKRIAGEGIRINQEAGAPPGSLTIPAERRQKRTFFQRLFGHRGS